jgi:hypothetical protein
MPWVHPEQQPAEVRDLTAESLFATIVEGAQQAALLTGLGNLPDAETSIAAKPGALNGTTPSELSDEVTEDLHKAAAVLCACMQGEREVLKNGALWLALGIVESARARFAEMVAPA